MEVLPAPELETRLKRAPSQETQNLVIAQKLKDTVPKYSTNKAERSSRIGTTLALLMLFTKGKADVELTRILLWCFRSSVGAGNLSCLLDGNRVEIKARGGKYKEQSPCSRSNSTVGIQINISEQTNSDYENPISANSLEIKDGFSHWWFEDEKEMPCSISHAFRRRLLDFYGSKAPILYQFHGPNEQLQ
ncbi:hypothetical protein Vadar_000556 [Vaccinium darrowii]|uniref:Uncharacterized protein n=1 Tax=Vaccinium darrowii TaxID=229202 RepID=A0ACB7Z1D7_9ERIC|nr:hypothetical protein Vadar_000556 [Vaccinium darrowii]